MTTDDTTKEIRRKEFDNFFFELMIDTTCCFQRDVLRDCKEELWEAWLKRTMEWVARGHDHE